MKTPPHSVLELRQYKVVPGRRDDMIDVFERWFVDSQEAEDMRLVGQFRDRDDPNRFTWIRSFVDMEARERGLNAFYFGPVWQAHRDEANPLLLDNDNVLLLKPLTPELAFADTDRREPPEPAGPVVATIFYLWKDPAEGFSQLFAERLAATGLPTLGVYVPETSENTFPRLPVRQHEKVLVWFSRVEDQAWLAADLDIADAQERPAQVLRLDPTSRSRLR
ncbi:NIPSNAP family protein [Caulobacter segnis]